MGYDAALEEAGAEVHTSKYFGSWQGDWWAKVTFNGTTGWVHGYFGSCSVCDPFERFIYDRFGWDYDYESEEYKAALKEFGLNYLDDLYTDQQALEAAGRDIEWDTEAENVVAFIRENVS